jgi:hypothetical protein
VPSDVVRLEWRNRIEAEYRSAALTHHYVLWLLQLGFSPDLIRDGLDIVADELDHARLSHDVHIDAGGADAPAIDRGSLTLDATITASAQDLDVAVVLATVRVFCLGETVAVPLFRHLRSGCNQSTAKSALDRIVVDEGRHSAFGWAALDAMVERWGVDRVRSIVTPALPSMIGALDDAYGTGAVARDAAASVDDDRTWGVVPPSEYEPILRTTATNVWADRFAARGIDFAGAWHESTGTC